MTSPTSDGANQRGPVGLTPEVTRDVMRSSRAAMFRVFKSIVVDLEGMVQVAFLLSGVALLAWALSIPITNPPSKIREVFMGMSVALIAPSIITLTIKLIEKSKETRRTMDFYKFFGIAPGQKTYRILFPTFEFPVGSCLRFPHREAKMAGAVPKGVRYAASLDEVSATSRLAKLFAQFGLRVELCRDTADDASAIPESSCISIGLGFSRTTTALSKVCGGLFEIVYQSDEKYGDITTDDLLVRGGKPQAHKNCEYALVGRILHNDRPYLICAGRTGHGTVTTLNYLAENWQQMLRSYESEGRDLRSSDMISLLYHLDGCADPMDRTNNPRFYFGNSTAQTVEGIQREAEVVKTS